MQTLHQVWYWSTEGVKRYWVDNKLGSKEWFDLDLWICDLKIKRDHLLIGRNPCTKVGIDQVKGSKDIEQTTQCASKEWFDLDLWIYDLKINRDNQLIEENPCTKLRIDQVKWSKDIKRPTQCASKEWFDLDLWTLTWKSIGIIYSLRATPAPSLVLIKWSCQKILSGQHDRLRRVVWHWPLNM